MLDCVFENARIIDGTGNPWFMGSVGITNGRISKVSPCIEESAYRRIDVSGLTLAPGFIDVHAHSDFSAFWDPLIEYKITQGITSEICGNCGISGFPVRDYTLTRMQADVCGCPKFKPLWDSAEEYIINIKRQPLGTNIGFLLGYNTVREYVAGVNESLTHDETLKIADLIHCAMKAGIMGLSSGLVYEPGNYTTTDELIEACRIVAREYGIYVSHTRGLRETLAEGVKEAIEIGKKAKIPVQVSHLMPQYGGWEQLEPSLRAVEAARQLGIDVTFDVHLDTIGGTSVFATLPPHLKEGGIAGIKERLSTEEGREEAIKSVREFLGPGTSGFLHHSRWDLLWISESPACPEYVGKSFADIAEDEGRDPWEIYFDQIIKNGEKLQIMGYYTRVEELRKALSHPLAMVGTDAVPLASGQKCFTPRNYSTIPKLFGKYVRDEGLISLEQAVQKVTSKPALRFRLPRRGVITEGFHADIVVFDPDNISPGLTDEMVLSGIKYDQPYASGTHYVMVNGIFEIEEGSITGNLGGKVMLRRT